MGILEISNLRNSRNFEFCLIFLFNFLQIKNIIISLLKILIIDLLRILKITIVKLLIFRFLSEKKKK